MKKQLLSMALVGASASAFAQLPVSTSPENKNVVLEEFTGIYCQFCPDGHKRAQEFKNANPGDVFLINIHTGGFAAPNGSDPDFRTTFGTDLANQSQLAGYPAGTINRRNFAGFEQNGSPAGATAMSRGDWAPIGTDSIMTEASYVNIAVEGDLDVATRTLTVDVETYFTAAAPGSVNLNVAVLQNNVQGPQTGAATWYPANILPNGNYNHQHMLRHLMDGQWGTAITPVMSQVMTNQYTWVIPADINGVPVELGDLEIVAFIAEGQQNIISGNSGPINITLPPGGVLVDASCGDNSTLPTNYCDDAATPSVVVNNAGNNPITSYDVSYSLNGGAPVTQSITTPLAPGASATHDFAAVNAGFGVHSFVYSVTVTGTNDIELVSGNNSAGSAQFTVIPEHGLAPYSYDFESDAALTFPAGLYEENPTGFRVTALDNSVVNGLTTPLGGFGNSETSLWWDFYGASNIGAEASALLEIIDLTGFDSATLTFSHSHAQFQTSNDELQVLVSDDCGATWSTEWSAAGAALATAAANQNRYFADPAEWDANEVDLTAYAGSEILISFKGISDYGNSLYVDDINVTADTAAGGGGNPGDTNNPGDTTGIASRVDILESVTVFPNPASDIATLEVKSSEASTIEVIVYDVVGKIVLQEAPRSMSIGVEQITLNTSTLTDGVYYLNILSNGQHQTEKLVIRK